MGYTAEQLDAMGATDDQPSAVVARPARVHTGPAKGTRVKDVPLSQGAYESVLAPVRSRLGALGQATGVDIGADGNVVLDHDASTALTEGEDPEVRDAIRSQLAFDTRKGGEGKASERSFISKLFTEDPHEEGKRFPEFNEKWGGFVPEDTDKRERAQKAYDRAHLFITKKEEGTSPVPEDVDKYLIAKTDSPARKAYVRKLIADRFREEARLLPAQGGGAELAAQARKVADYIETLDEKHLSPEARTGRIVEDLAKHASGPVARAVKTSISDALLTGFGNNAAPLTIGLGSAIAKAPGLVAPGGGDTLDPADLAGGGGAADASGAPVGMPGTRAAAGNIGQNVDQVHQAIVEGLTGKPPEEQAAFIEQLKREHPLAYHLAAGAGWLADPVGLLGGKALQGAKAAGAAAGLGKLAAPAAVAAVGAPVGVLAGRSQGSENDLLNAGLGVAGEAGGQLVGKGLGKVLSGAAGAPARVAEVAAKATQEDLSSEARAMAHKLGQVELRTGARISNPWDRIYAEMEAAHPGMPKTHPQMAHPVTGHARPNVNPELAHAVDTAMSEATARAAGSPGGTAVHGASTTQQAIHPNVVLMNEGVPVSGKIGPFLHAVALHGPVRAGAMAAIGAKSAIGKGADQVVGKLVTAIRGGNAEAFHAALRQAHADGISPAMIDAATAAFHRRNGHGR